MELNIVKHKHGYRWRVFKNGNLFCTGTDYHSTEEKAQREAIETFCKSWEIDTTTVSEGICKYFDSVDKATDYFRKELAELDYQTTRTFWVGDKRYIARKTNQKAGYVNLTVTEA